MAPDMPAPAADLVILEAQEVLFNQGILMHLYVGRWTANKKIRQRDLLLTDVDADVVYLGHKKLLPKEAQQRLTYIEGQARRYLDTHSLDFPIGKAKYVYYRTLPQIVGKLREFKQQWIVAVEELIRDYATYQAQQLDRLDAQAHALAEAELAKASPEQRVVKMPSLREWEADQKKANRELYPDVNTLRARYGFEWRLFRVSALEGVGEMTALSQDELIEARDNIRRDFQGWVRQASAQIHQELGEAAANAKRMLEENGRLAPRSLRPLFDAFETFRAVSFSEGSEFQNVIDRIRQRYLTNDPSGGADYQRTAEAVNGSPEELRELLSTIGSLAQDQIAEEAGIRSVSSGQFARLLDM